MPNWCNNSVTLTHKDPEQIKRAQEALARGELMNEFVPVPAQLKEATASYSDEYKEQNEKNIADTGYASWYDFCVSEWGTKWDVEAWSNEVTNDGLTLECSFDTAWSPPIAFFDKLVGKGFDVVAYYWEPGIGFVGKYDNGFDEYYEYHDETSDTVRDLIGAELDDMFNISEDMAQWEEENEE